MRYPVDNRIKIPGLIPFGGTDPAGRFGRHAGDDSANSTGTPVFAPASGVATAYTTNSYKAGGTDHEFHGNTVEIRTPAGLYPHVFHMSRVVITPGQEVKEGDLVGYSGATGKGITGPHVHFGVATRSVPTVTSFDQYLDPMQQINKEEEMPITKDQENVLSFLATGDYPGPGYDYRFVGQPATQAVLDQMLNFWSKVSVDEGLRKPRPQDTPGGLDKGTVLDYLNKNLT